MTLGMVYYDDDDGPDWIGPLPLDEALSLAKEIATYEGTVFTAVHLLIESYYFKGSGAAAIKSE